MFRVYRMPHRLQCLKFLHFDGFLTTFVGFLGFDTFTILGVHILLCTCFLCLNAMVPFAFISSRCAYADLHSYAL